MNEQKESDLIQSNHSMWITANAGSGKTRNLIIRILNLLLKGVSPEKILCLTYTNAAALEMQERVFKELGSWTMKSDQDLKKIISQFEICNQKTNKKSGNILKRARRLFAHVLETSGGIKILTIHGFCASVLRRFPMEAGISPNFLILSDIEKEKLIEEAFLQMTVSDEEHFVQSIRDFGVSNLIEFAQQILKYRNVFSQKFNKAKFLRCYKISEFIFNNPEEWNRLILADKVNSLDRIQRAFSFGTKLERNFSKLLIGLENYSFEERFNRLEKIFCTNGTARSLKFYPSKSAKAEDPRLETLFSNLQGKFLKLLEKKRTSSFLKKSEDLHEVGLRFIMYYEEQKRKHGFLDYDDLISKTCKLFSDFDTNWVLYELDGGIDHILLDESQDTSILQWEMLIRLTDDFFSDERALRGDRTFYAVGDEKQSIYSFQGADLTSLQSSQKFFEDKLKLIGEKLYRVELAKSYRSSKAILDFVDVVFHTETKMGISKRTRHLADKKTLPGRVELWPTVPKPKSPRQKSGWWTNAESKNKSEPYEMLASEIATTIKSILKSGDNVLTSDPSNGRETERRVEPGDFMILLRSRGPLYNVIIRHLNKLNLPFAGSDRLQLREELAIKDLISLLRFLVDKSDDLSLAEALRSPLFGISELELFKIASDRKGKLYDSLVSIFPGHDTVKILEDLFLRLNDCRPFEIIERILINHRGRFRLVSRLGKNVHNVLDEFLEQSLIYESVEPPHLSGFIDWVSGTDAPIKRRLPKSSSLIKIMTVHGAKGLESPIVILPDTFQSNHKYPRELLFEQNGFIGSSADGNGLPNFTKLFLDEKKRQVREEEQRLFYVAVTRAKQWLILCGAGHEPAIKKEEINLESWYLQSKKAIIKLSGKEKNCKYLKGRRTLVLEHHWGRTPKKTGLPSRINFTKG